MNIIAPTAVFVLACIFPFLTRCRAEKKLGKKIAGFSAENPRPFSLAAVLALFLAALIFSRLRNFGLLQRLAIEAAAIYGGFFCSREFLLKKLDGIYESALVLNGKVYRKKDFSAFCLLDDDGLIENRTILYENRAGNKRQLVFSTVEDCMRARDAFRAWLQS